MADLQKLFKVTPMVRAYADFESAKGEYDAATLALVNQEPGCEARAHCALKMMNEARLAALLRLQKAKDRCSRMRVEYPVGRRLSADQVCKALGDEEQARRERAALHTATLAGER